jgi:SAM-dependent methyltransferase
MSKAFDRYDRDYEEVVERSIAFSGLKHDFFLEAKAIALQRLFAGHFGSRRPDLLDLGCGVGRLHPLLADVAGSLAGTDVSEASILRAREDNHAVEYRPMEGAIIPWDENSFDVSLAVCVFHHIPVAERAAAAAEMVRVTRPGGLVILIEHNPWNPLTRLSVLRCPFDHDAVLLGAREARTLLAGAGLAGIRSRHMLLLPTRRAGAPAIERAFETLPLGAQYLAWGAA